MRRGLVFLTLLAALAAGGGRADAASAPFWTDDGRHAVFPRGSEPEHGLFVLDTHAQSGHFLALPKAFNVVPAPGGRHVAAVGSSETEVWTLGGGLLARVEGWAGSGAWSPDGTRWAYDSGERVRVFDTRTGAIRDVAGGENVNWSPTGDELAVVRKLGPETWQVSAVRADGLGQRELATLTAPTSWWFPVGVEWSPTGDALAVVGYGHVVVVRDGSGVETTIPTELSNSVVWSPGGARLAIIGWGRTTLADQDGGRLVQLPLTEDLAWSPDGAAVYHLSENQVVVTSAYGGPSVTVGPGARFALSPDGRRLAVIRLSDESDCFEERSGIIDLATRKLTSTEPCWIGGGAYADELIGRTDAPDEIDGFDGADRLYGRGGDDTLKGWQGPDRLYGGTGRDYVRAGSGNDRAFTVDGERDLVDCGPGRDVVTADRLDEIARNCERVVRRR